MPLVKIQRAQLVSFKRAPTPATVLKNALDLLTDYQHQVELTGAFLKKLDVSQLLMPAELRADFADGRNALVQGLLVVDEARLKQLPVATLQEWLASGELGLLYAHMLSLGNVKHLVQRMPAIQPSVVPEPQPQPTSPKAKRSMATSCQPA